MKCPRCNEKLTSAEYEKHNCGELQQLANHAFNTKSVVSQKTESVVDKSNYMDVLIGVRLHSRLAEKLDKARGGMTRPAKIREILEKEL